MSKISIIIPVYNSEKSLEKCLTSVINQNYRDIEIIIINDGSKDSSQLIIEQYSKIDKRIKAIRTENKGVSNARNLGIQNANGKYICFLDSDDYVDKDMYSELVKQIKENDMIICGWKQEEVNNNMEVKLSEIEGDLQKVIESVPNKDITKYTNPPWNKMFKLELIKKNMIDFNSSISLGEDYIFNLKVMVKCRKIKTITNALYYYKIETNGLNLKKRTIQEYWDNYSRVIKNLEEINDENEEINIDGLVLNEISSTLYHLINFYEDKREVKKIIKEISNDEIFKKKQLKANTKKNKILVCIFKMKLDVLVYPMFRMIKVLKKLRRK